MQQRVMVAIALAGSPDLPFWSDEPTFGCWNGQTIQAQRLVRLILKLTRERAQVASLYLARSGALQVRPAIGSRGTVCGASCRKWSGAHRMQCSTTSPPLYQKQLITAVLEIGAKDYQAPEGTVPVSWASAKGCRFSHPLPTPQWRRLRGRKRPPLCQPQQTATGSLDHHIACWNPRMTVPLSENQSARALKQPNTLSSDRGRAGVQKSQTRAIQLLYSAITA